MTDAATRGRAGAHSDPSACHRGEEPLQVFGRSPQSAVDKLRAGARRDELGDAGTAAVIDASFDVEPGEIFVIMGLSGSGKSTIIRMLNGLHDATAGTVEVQGDPLTGVSPARLRALRRERIAMVFQHFALLPHRTVAANVAYPLEIRGVGKAERLAKADEILALVGLDGWATSSPRPCPAGCSSASGSPARSPPTPTSFSWTRRSARSTRSSAVRCRSSCSSSSGR